MSSLLDRIGAFFLEPPADRDAAPSAEDGSAPPNGAPPAATPESGLPADARSSRLGFAPSSAARSAFGGFAPPLASGSDPARDASSGEALVTRSAVRSSRAPVEPAMAPEDVRSGDAGAQVAAPWPSVHGFAAVLGAAADAVPAAAACAGELRARARAAAAVLCVWGGGEPPAGATTPAVRRLAARLAADGLAATASGRLAWVALDPSPADAATQVLRARALAEAPIVLAIAGPRPAALEPLLADAELALVVLPAEAEEPLRSLALATLPSRATLAVPPLPPGPPRWAAMAGLARMRSLAAVPR